VGSIETQEKRQSELNILNQGQSLKVRKDDQERKIKGKPLKD
jgi:hypothetical protein